VRISETRALVIELVEASAAELDFRASVLRLAPWVGWAAIAFALSAIALHVAESHRGLLLAVTLAAATANAATMRVPWRSLVESRRGVLIVDLWSGAVLGFVVVLVAVGGASFTSLLFLALPAVAVVQEGWRRGAWLAASGVTCVIVAAFRPQAYGPTLLRLAIVAGVVGLAIVAARTIVRETAARRRAADRAELEHLRAVESHHRITNSLQSVADLALLGGADGRDRTASRIRSIAHVHRLLTESEGAPLSLDSLLREIAADATSDVRVDAESVVLEPRAAQTLGLVANELVTNAVRHGRAPISLHLYGREALTLVVDDEGELPADPAIGSGLQLVERLVQYGLGGTFELARRTGGGTRAIVAVPAPVAR
jgi:two-component sensor histidine kinase